MSESISLSSLLLLAGIAVFVVRYFFSSSSDARGQGGGGAGGGGRSGANNRVNIAAVGQVAAMFPQLDRRAIAWDLQRNGGNPQATVERMLTTGRLEQPPPSFQPQGLEPAQATRTTGVSGAGKPARSTHPDLITRYHLESKLAEGEQAEADAADGAASSSSGWSANKGERAAMLQRRREQMILQARRKMEEKDRKGKAVEPPPQVEA